MSVLGGFNREIEGLMCKSQIVNFFFLPDLQKGLENHKMFEFYLQQKLVVNMRMERGWYEERKMFNSKAWLVKFKFIYSFATYA